MKDLLTVRLGKKRAADLEAFCRKNGVSKADVVRNGIDEKNPAVGPWSSCSGGAVGG